mmetsp:Transcript_51520/g.115922  ORF Transcript_51520/g.115922 Transcript_51520/m.115922 type:complete len:247 (+) Transcript_51520:177-917(+)|eukprot:CAMPEP_0197905608 /NCGR_PEP_ID=MMETSP1439-20131203/60760_1 /TAXON_ID=66791 /ORGANISM="Gonyaulax spinifera, Strain CCMP409" /LENGTH=246 /DNA_ID=CAMNT_0043526893 /DNA_START=159 /DNA_END=899 /DNA_ORIENTATION=-
MAETASLASTHSMFLCMPLRLGILTVASLTSLSSAFYIVGTAGWQSAFRPFVGGYGLGSRVAIGIVQVTGIIFGPLGVLGAWYQKRDYIVTFNAWQAFHLVVWIFTFVVDMPLVWRCEEWVNSIEEMTQANGWNQLLYEVAMSGGCGHERRSYFILSVLCFLASAYVVWKTAQYQDFMGQAPKHLLRVPKDLSSGAFYAHSMGERAHLNGMWGKHDYNPLRQGPAPEILPSLAAGPPPFAPAGQLV